MPEKETFEQAQERVKALQSGEAVERPIEEHHGWRFGERVRVIEDDEAGYAYAGDEGVLVISEVGAVEFNNLRTDVSVIFDGNDSPSEVDVLNLESAE